MKNFFKSLSIFGIWLIITAVCGVAIFLGFSAYACSAIIMSTFMLLPMRDWTVRLFIWGIDFLSSNMDSFRDWITPWATMNTVLNGQTRTENKGFYRALKVVIAAVYGFVALILWVMQGLSANIVYGFAHNAVVIIRKLSGNGLERAGIFIWLLLCITCTAIFVWFISLIVRGVWGVDADGNLSNNVMIRDCVIMVASFIISRIKNYVFLEYTWDMIGTSLLSCLILLILPILFIIFILPRIGPLVRNVFH